MKLPVSEPVIGSQELKYLNEVVISNRFTQGPFVERFEKLVAEHSECDHAIATCNGTAALHLALVAMGLHKGMEVLVPTLSFVATANAVKYCGAKPVFVDVDPKTWNMDPESMRNAVTSRTVGVIPVHLYGQPADMYSVLSLAFTRGLWVVEDAAEAFGATYHSPLANRQVPVGSESSAAMFSLYGNKLITTGEGGMVVCNNPELAQRMRHLRGQGVGNKSYWHDTLGYNYRMTEMQAALGCGQFESLEKHLAARVRNRYWYGRYLNDYPWCHFQECSGADGNVWWMTGVLLDGIDETGRDEIMARLALKGIETRPFFYPLHTLPFYKTKQRLPVAEDIARRGLCLPSGGRLTREDIEFISQSLIEAYQWQQSLNPA